MYGGVSFAQQKLLCDSITIKKKKKQIVDL